MSGRDGVAEADQVERVQRRRGVKRRPAGQTLVEDRPQAVDVGERPDLRGAGGLLRGHVRGRAQDAVAGQGPFLGEALGQSEIGDLGHAVRREQDVGRFQIAVNDTAQVGGVHRPGEQLEHRRRGPIPERSLPHLLGQGAAFEELQDEIRQHRPDRRLPLTDLVDLNDVRMLKGRDGIGLLAEAAQVVRGGRGAGADHLQSDQPPRPFLLSLVHNTHAAAADFAQELVAGDHSGCRDRRLVPGCPGIGAGRARVAPVQGFVNRRVGVETQMGIGEGGVEEKLPAQGLGVVGEAGQVLLQGRPFPMLLPQHHLRVDKVEQTLGIAEQFGKDRNIGLDAQAVALLPALLLVVAQSRPAFGLGQSVHGDPQQFERVREMARRKGIRRHGQVPEGRRSRGRVI